MINPLLLLPILNVSAILRDGKCFGQPPPHTPHIVRPAYHDCVEAIRFIPQFDKSHAPMTFGRKATAGYKVPKKWIYRDCVLKLDVENEDDVDEATFERIQFAARGLTELCVRFNPPFLGGITDVGKYRSLHISVFGFSPLADATTK